MPTPRWQRISLYYASQISTNKCRLLTPSTSFDCQLNLSKGHVLSDSGIDYGVQRAVVTWLAVLDFHRILSGARQQSGRGGQRPLHFVSLFADPASRSIDALFSSAFSSPYQVAHMGWADELIDLVRRRDAKNASR